MGQTSVNVGTWSVRGAEHANGREWGYSYHLGAAKADSPPYTTRATRNAVMAAATQSEAAWLAAMPAPVSAWVGGYGGAIRDMWRQQDAEP